MTRFVALLFPCSVGVLEPPSIPKYEEMDIFDRRQYKCYVDKQGTPNVEVRIQVGNVFQSSSSIVADLTQTVDCCVVGDAVQCLNQTDIFCVSVFVPFGPRSIKLSPETDSYTVRTGDTLTNINCSADCDPPCSYSWYKDGQKLFSTSSFTYTIKNKNDAGTYTCVALRRPSNKATRHIKVIVIYAATVMEFHAVLKPAETTVIVNHHDSLELLCLVDSYPSSTINISKSGVTLKHISNSYQSVYLIENAQCTDTGTYVCSAQNERFGTDDISNKSLMVFVKCPLKAENGYESVIFTPVSHSVVLEVIVYGYPTTSTYTWYKKLSNEWTPISQNGSFIIGNNEFTSNLTIVNVTKDYLGKYAVKADNGLGGQPFTKMFFVYQEGKPQPPKYFRCHLSVSSSDSFIIEWEAGLNSGFVQTFVIQYRGESQNLWKEYLKPEIITSTRDTFKVVLGNLTGGAIYLVRMLSINAKGNSSFTRELRISIPAVCKTETGSTIALGSLAGGIVGGIVVGSVASVVLLLIYQHVRASKSQKRSNTAKCQKEGKQSEVYYNVAEEQIHAAEHQSEARGHKKSEQGVNEYEELKHRVDEQQYEHVKPD